LEYLPLFVRSFRSNSTSMSLHFWPVGIPEFARHFPLIPNGGNSHAE
jgi:hypothetical protein